MCDGRKEGGRKRTGKKGKEGTRDRFPGIQKDVHC